MNFHKFVERPPVEEPNFVGSPESMDITATMKSVSIGKAIKDGFDLLERELINCGLETSDIASLLQHIQGAVEQVAFHGLIKDMNSLNVGRVETLLSDRNIEAYNEKLQRPLVEYLSFLCTSEITSADDGAHTQTKFFFMVPSTESNLVCDGPPDTATENLCFFRSGFQDYLAAKHYTKHWLNDNIGAETQLEEICPDVLLSNEKYTSRYTNLWRFVVAFIQDDTGPSYGERSIFDFFKQLDSSPIDEIGYIHHRTLMYALSELVESTDQEIVGLRSTLQSRLHAWTLSQIRAQNIDDLDVVHASYGTSYRRVCLIPEDDFPTGIIDNLLNSSDHDVQRFTLAALSERSYLTRGTEDLIKSIIASNPSSLAEGIHALRCQTNLSGGTISILITHLQYGDIEVQKETLDVLSRQSVLALEDVLHILSIREQASEELCGCVGWGDIVADLTHPNLSMEVLLIVLKLITTCSPVDQGQAIEAFVNLFKLVQDHSMSSVFYKLDPSERLRAIEPIFKGADWFSEELLNTFICFTKDPDPQIRLAMVQSHWQFGEPARQQVIDIILPLLNDPDSEVQEATLWLVSTNRGTLSPASQKVLIAQLTDANEDSRNIAAEILIGSSLSEDSVLSLGELLGIDDRALPKVVSVICSQQELPETVTKPVVEMLESSDHELRRLALGAVQECDQINDGIIANLITILQEDVSDLHQDIAEMLVSRRWVPEDLVEAFSRAFLNISSTGQLAIIDKWASVRLEGRLPQQLLNIVTANPGVARVATALVDQDGFDELLKEWILDSGQSASVRIAALDYLIRPPSLTNRFVSMQDQYFRFEDWATLLKDPDVSIEVKQVVQEVSIRELFPFFLEELSTDPQAQEDQLKSRYSEFPTFWIPNRDDSDIWAHVSSTSLKLIAQILQRKNLHADARLVSIEILGAAPALPDDTLDILIDLLKDPDRQDIVQFSEDILLLIDESPMTPHQLPRKVIDLLFLLIARQKAKDTEYLRIQRKISLTICLKQLEDGYLQPRDIADVLNGIQSTASVTTLLEQIVSEQLDCTIAPLLNTEPLATLSRLWLKDGSETACCQHSDGLYIHRSDKKSCLGLSSDQTHLVLEILRSPNRSGSLV